MIAVDIGGTLAKIVYFAGERLFFYRFETVNINQMIEFIQSILCSDNNTDDSNKRPTVIKATGGGAYKYKQMLEERLHLTVEREDEMASTTTTSNMSYNIA